MMPGDGKVFSGDEVEDIQVLGSIFWKIYRFECSIKNECDADFLKLRQIDYNSSRKLFNLFMAMVSTNPPSVPDMIHEMKEIRSEMKRCYGFPAYQYKGGNWELTSERLVSDFYEQKRRDDRLAMMRRMAKNEQAIMDADGELEEDRRLKEARREREEAKIPASEYISFLLLRKQMLSENYHHNRCNQLLGRDKLEKWFFVNVKNLMIDARKLYEKRKDAEFVFFIIEMDAFLKETLQGTSYMAGYSEDHLHVKELNQLVEEAHAAIQFIDVTESDESAQPSQSMAAAAAAPAVAETPQPKQVVNKPSVFEFWATNKDTSREEKNKSHSIRKRR